MKIYARFKSPIPLNIKENVINKVIKRIFLGILRPGDSNQRFKFSVEF
jgi:hypothetical protein